MQLTNIARDVVVDAKMGRRYLPGSWVNDMTPEEILQAAENPDGENAAIISSAVRRLLALAEEVLRKRSNRSILPSSKSTFSMALQRKYTVKSEFNCYALSTLVGTKASYIEA